MEKDILSISLDEKYTREIEDFDMISIFGKETLEEIQTIISDVTGLAFVTVDFKGEPLTELTNFSPHCRKVRENPMYETICKLSDASGAIRAAVTKKKSIYFCPFKLLEMAIPVVINGRYLGAFIGGQIMCDDAPESVYRMQEQFLPEESAIDEEIFKGEIQGGKRYSYKEFVSVSKLVELIISQLIKKEIISGYHQVKNKNRIAELEKEIKDEKREKKEYQDRLEMVENDINRLTMVNSIDSISNLSIIEKADRTGEFVNFYRKYILNLLDSSDISVNKSIEMTESFFKMKKVQYGDKFDYLINQEGNYKKVIMPYKVMLPYVQLLSLIGLSMNKGSYRIEIKLSTVKEDVIIKIKDNGPGLSDVEILELSKTYNLELEALKTLDYVQRLDLRLAEDYGDNYRVIREHEKGKGNRVYIKFPKK